MYRRHSAVMLADDNPWNNITGFMNKYGVLENYPERSGQGLLFHLSGNDADPGHETDCNQIGNQSGTGRGADR